MVNGAFMVKKALPSNQSVKPWGSARHMGDGFRGNSRASPVAARQLRPSKKSRRRIAGSSRRQPGKAMRRYFSELLIDGELVIQVGAETVDHRDNRE